MFRYFCQSIEYLGAMNLVLNFCVFYTKHFYEYYKIIYFGELKLKSENFLEVFKSDKKLFFFKTEILSMISFPIIQFFSEGNSKKITADT